MQEDERRVRGEGRSGSPGGASEAGLAAAMVRPAGEGLAHWGGRRAPRTEPVDVAGGPLPGRGNLPETGR